MIMDGEGYKQAVAEVMQMSGPDLMRYLDGLYGRSNLPRSCTVEDMREEALLQTERKFGPDYERFLLSKRNAFSSTLVPKRHESQPGEFNLNEDDDDEFKNLPAATKLND